jgi:hypothetical protein
LIDMFSATESKGTRTPHEYIRDILPFRYQECISCGNRTGLACIKCGYCYSCHWKKEKAEKKLLDDKPEIFPSSVLSTRKNELTENEAEQSSQQLIVDVYGRTSEFICTYHRCNHKFPVHGSSRYGCKCKHPTNKTLGIFVRYH